MATTTKFELKTGAATREAFGQALVELGRTNPGVVALDADLSKSTYTAAFAKEFPDRFFECGIAEANMVAIGAGLASAGKIPFASSFSGFGLNKGFEQLRVTAAFPNVNLKIVGTHSGNSIGAGGPPPRSVGTLCPCWSPPRVAAGAIVVAEEHLIDSGLGVRVAQVVAETHPAVMEFVGVNNTYAESATPDELLDKYGLRASNVAAAARRAVGRK